MPVGGQFPMIATTLWVAENSSGSGKPGDRFKPANRIGMNQARARPTALPAQARRMFCAAPVSPFAGRRIKGIFAGAVTMPSAKVSAVRPFVRLRQSLSSTVQVSVVRSCAAGLSTSATAAIAYLGVVKIGPGADSQVWISGAARYHPIFTSSSSENVRKARNRYSCAILMQVTFQFIPSRLRRV